VARRRGFPFRTILFLLCLLAGLYLARSLWLPLLARPLIHNEGPAKAEAAVVLAGDTWGHRIVTAAELVKAGYVPLVIVSGPSGFYGHHEDELAIDFAVRQGYPREWFVPLPNAALSTREEASVVLQELRRRGIHSFLLVTSDYHTRRALRIYRATEQATGGGPDIRVVAAPDEHFRPSDWWTTREGLKTVFIEWSKTAATAVGI